MTTPDSPILPDIYYSSPILDSVRGLVSESEGLVQSDDTNPKSIEFSDLRRLLELANTSSYTEAAYLQGISESHLRRIVRKLNEFVGFKLVEKSSTESTMLTANAKLWLKSFSEVHSSLSSLNECLTNIRNVQGKPSIGISPCIAFTQNLWQFLSERYIEADFNCRAGADIEGMIQGDYDCLIGLQRVKDDALESRILYKEPLHYYHLKEHDHSSRSDSVNIILQHPMTPDPGDSRLFELPAFAGKNIRFLEVANVLEALHLVSNGEGIFPSLLLNEGIVPSEITASSFSERIDIPIYLITSIQSHFDFDLSRSISL